MRATQAVTRTPGIVDWEYKNHIADSTRKQENQ